MKKIFITILVLVIFSTLFTIKNWKIFTNTTHIYDVEQVENRLYIATWGGLVVFDLNDNTFERTYTKIDGLSDGDIRDLDYMGYNNQLLIGTVSEGIDRFDRSDFIMPITEIIGLASNSVYKIVIRDSLILAATKEGLSVFADNPGFPFPLLINNYSSENGLSTNKITSLQISGDGYVFCGSTEGLDYVHIDSMNIINSWSHLDSDNSLLPGNEITSLSIMNDEIAIGTDNGIALCGLPHFDSWTIYDESNLPFPGSVYPVYLDKENNLWFSYGYWSEYYLDISDSADYAITKISESGEQTFWTKEDLGINSTKIMGFTELDDDRICAFTWGEGLVFLDANEWINYSANCIIASLIRDLVIDKNDKLWVCNGYKPPPSNPLLPKGTAGISCYDGEYWTNFSADESPLTSNNIYSLEVDNDNRKWLGAWYIHPSNPYGWDDGISIYDDNIGTWEYITSSDGLRNNAISFLRMDEQNRMWVCSYGSTSGGINVIDLETDEVMTTFDLYESTDDLNDPSYIFLGEERIYFGGIITGLRIWNNTSIPVTDGVYWSLTPFSDLVAGQVFAIDSRIVNYREQIWVASVNGLFMYGWTTYFNPSGEYLWFKYGTHIKKQAYKYNQWFDEESPEFWYIVGQERLYGSVPTFPTALYIDPFGLIWIGTNDNGITVYNTQRDLFTNYNMENSLLISNKITSFAYEKYTGTLYIGTDEGLHSVEIGISAEANKETKLNNTIAYPNPFYPEVGEKVKIENTASNTMPKGDTKCYIYDLSGDLVIKLKKDIYEQFSWNGNNKEEKKCGSGIYLYVVTTPDGQISRGKIALIR